VLGDDDKPESPGFMVDGAQEISYCSINPIPEFAIESNQQK
jgi:hypothetical protein